ncbi:caspase, EACC1-associated type [Streptomyces sp. NPDC004838]
MLIGFSDYSEAPDLPAVENNLEGLREFFTSPRGWSLPSEHCVVIDGAEDAADLIAPLREATSAARDTLLLYYAGHGILDEDLEFVLSLPASRLDEPWTGVSYKWIRNFVARSRAKSRIAVIDSCFSGKAQAVMGGTSEAVKSQAAAAGTVVITSARDDRVALAPEGEKYTAFTGEFLSVLSEGIEGGPSVLSVDQVYESIKDALAAKGRPRPDKTGSDTSGRMGLAINQAYIPDPVGSTTSLSPRESLKELVARLQQLGSLPTTLRRSSTTVEHSIFRDKTGFIGRNGLPPDEPDGNPGGGRYVNPTRVSSGGMGSIFLAEDSLLGRAVVLKSLHSYLLQGRHELKHHLYYEARAAAALNHPSIGSVYDLIDDSTGQFIVMEYVQGWDMKVVLSAARLTVVESVAVILDVLDGLDHSHAAGVIHCDVKPANFILGQSGRVKILDFGISSINASMHHEDRVIGTPVYMSPEAWRGAPPDVQRDIYGAGAALYEMVTGQSLHPPGRDIYEIGTTPPTIRTREFVPEVPLVVEKVLEKALAPQPDARYRSAAQMRAALSSIFY